jgi:phytoene desaturase
MNDHSSSSHPSRAIVIGAGLGGLSAAMRLGAKGYQVTLLDRLDRAGGRGSSITQNGHRFDLGPTIVTVPQVFRQLWKNAGAISTRMSICAPSIPITKSAGATAPPSACARTKTR